MGVRLPTEYQEVEWIESRSRTQWIDTGVQPSTDSNFKIFLCAMRLSNPGGQGNYFYGTSGNWCSMEYYSSKLNWNTGSSTHAVLIDAPIINSKFSIAIDYSNNRMTLSGFYSGSVRYSGTLGSGNLVIFAQKANTSMSQLRLYACKIWQGNKHQLVRDYVPCYRKSDNKPGLYDLVTKTFFVNQGTGEFAVGLDVIDSISPWMVARRRMLMQVKRKWPVLIMASSSSRSSGAATAMQNAMDTAGIDRKNKMVLIKSAVASVNNQVVFKDWINNDNNSGGFFRKTNGSYVSNVWNDSTTNGSLSVGDRFMVIDPTIDAVEYDKIVTVDSNIRNTPNGKSFFTQNVPDDGYYLAYRKLTPGSLVHYDFIAGIFSRSSCMGYKAESSLQSGSIANWDNSSYTLYLYPGDKVYFLKINV